MPEYMRPMDHEERKLYEKLLSKINQGLSGIDWDISLFLQRIKLHVEQLRESIQAELTADTHSKAAPEDAEALARLPELGSQTVYLSLYQADGNNMPKWAAVLSSLQKLSIGRPVYATEQAARAAMRGKRDPRCEAYVAVRVREQAILPPLGGVVQKDKFGNELLTLKEGVLRPENVLYFCHVSGRYQYQKKQLVIEPESSKWADKS